MSDEATDDSDGVDPNSPWPPWVQMFVMPFLEEVGLLPVLVAMLGHVVILVGPMLAALCRGQRFAAFPLTFFILISFWLCKTESEARFPGPVLYSVAGTWMASIVIGAVAFKTGVF